MGMISKVWVCKFGGSSVADVGRMAQVAQTVASLRSNGRDVVVVVSAMAGETDRLLRLADAMAPDEVPSASSDALLATGEQASAALMAMALVHQGVPARAMTGGEAGLTTHGGPGKAVIHNVDTSSLRVALQAGVCPVVAGFQGVDAASGQVRTLGRGGSDLTAVALAAALKAEACRVYTDVDGVYAADPRWVPDAPRFERLSFEDVCLLADAGAKVVQAQAAHHAAQHHVPLHVLSSFRPAAGTLVDNGPSVFSQGARACISLRGCRGFRITGDAADANDWSRAIEGALAGLAGVQRSAVTMVSPEHARMVGLCLPGEAFVPVWAALNNVVHHERRWSLTVDDVPEVTRLTLLGRDTQTPSPAKRGTSVELYPLEAGPTCAFWVPSSQLTYLHPCVDIQPPFHRENTAE